MAARTLAEALGDAARGRAGYVFVGQDGKTHRTYAELYDASSRAASLMRRLGLGCGDLVALVLADAEPFVTALFGASLAGAVPAILGPPASVGDLPRYLAATAGVLRASGARAVVTSPSLVASFEELRSTCHSLDLVVSADTLDESGGQPAAGASLDAVAFVQFTSGSTSAPKGVVITHRNLSANVDAILGPAGLGASQSDSVVSWLPLHHDMGLVGMALAPLYAGRQAVLIAPQLFVKRPAQWLHAISRYRGTVSFAPTLPTTSAYGV
jgi:fatty-acyl-CoA synthase